MKTFIQAVYQLHDQRFMYGATYVARVTHYYLGTRVKVQPVHGYDYKLVKDAETIYDSPTEFALAWNVKAHFELPEQAPKQRKRRVEDE